MKKESEIRSSSHTKYRCQYHIVFAPKYRRKVIYGELKKDIGQILRKLCEQKNVEILEAEACSDHIHMFCKYPAAYKCSTIYGISQGKKYIDDFRSTREFKTQVRFQKFLVQRVLRRYSRTKQKANSRIYKESA